MQRNRLISFSAVLFVVASSSFAAEQGSVPASSAVQEPSWAASVAAASGPSRVIYPDDRPDWVESAPVKDGALDRIAVTSGPHYSLGEARRQLEEAIKTAADEYVNHHLGASKAAQYITFEVTPMKTYEERPHFSFGPMYQSHALLQFDESFRRQVEQDWKEAVTLSRLVKTGLSGGAIFFLLAVVFGYLKADNATRGFYTRRLRFGAATMILAVAAAVYFAAQWIPWI